MATIRDMLAKKGSQVHSIDGSETVYEAVAEMVKHGVGALLVFDGDNICGIITERDYLRDIALEDRSSKTTKVSEISTCDIIAIEPECSVEEAMAIMTERHIRHLPVIEKGQLAGLISIGDLVKQASTDQEFHIRFLTDYVTDKYPA